MGKMKVNVHYHAVVNHCVQYINSVYLSLDVTCYHILIVKQFTKYLVSIILHNILDPTIGVYTRLLFPTFNIQIT